MALGHIALAVFNENLRISILSAPQLPGTDITLARSMVRTVLSCAIGTLSHKFFIELRELAKDIMKEHQPGDAQ